MNFARISRFCAHFAIAAVIAAAAGCSSTGSKGAPEAHIHHDRGMKLFDQQKYDESITEIELALRIDPLFTKAKADLGYVCYKRGFVDRAITEIEDAIKTDPNLSTSYTYLGEIYTEKK